MKLVAYVLDGHQVSIRPAQVEREWMDKAGGRFAYRCLPMNIANTYGWEILNPTGFEAVWSGGDELDAITINPDFGADAPAVSHFGFGILTFHVPCLFRTPPGIDLLIQGPFNRPKDGIAPLAGVVETGWSPYTFTMNWMFTSAGVPIRFDMAEPYCHMIPVSPGDLEAVEPEIRSLSTDPELKAQQEKWARDRQGFNVELREPGSPAQEAKWQKLYHRGLTPDARPIPAEHRTRVRLKQFHDLREPKSG